jgi:hypothetical protein
MIEVWADPRDRDLYLVKVGTDSTAWVNEVGSEFLLSSFESVEGDPYPYIKGVGMALLGTISLDELEAM